jgi:hypothetical protein
MPIKKHMNLLLRHAFTGDALSSDAEAVAIWLARPQNTVLGQLDSTTNAEFDKDNQQRLRKELLKAVPHLTRLARQLWHERCQKASIINGTGTGSPSPMTVSAYSSGTYVSTMTDIFEARSAGTEDPPASSPATGHDTCLFSPSKNDQPRAAAGNIDRPSVPASLSTQSTVRNTSQLDSGDQTITDRPDHHRANQQGWGELISSPLMGECELGSMRKGSRMTEDVNSQKSVSSASMSMAEGHRHTRTLQSQLRVQGPRLVASHKVPESSELTPEEPRRGTPLQKAPARTNPVRSGHPPEGSTEHLTLLLDTVGHGKLPEDYQPAGPPPPEIFKQPGDIPDSWVALLPRCRARFFLRNKRAIQASGGGFAGSLLRAGLLHQEVLKTLTQAVNRALE